MAIFVEFDSTALRAARNMDEEQSASSLEALNKALEEHVPELALLVEEAHSRLDDGVCALVLPVSWRPGGNPGLNFFADGTSFRGMALLWAPVGEAYIAQLNKLEAGE